MITFNVNFQLEGIKKKVEASMKLGQFALDTQVQKDSNFFIPMDSHELEKSSFTASRLGNGIVAWNTPYARRLYYNPQYNFSTDKNPNAQGLWFEAAKARFKTHWEKIVQESINKNL